MSPGFGSFLPIEGSIPEPSQAQIKVVEDPYRIPPSLSLDFFTEEHLQPGRDVLRIAPFYPAYQEQRGVRIVSSELQHRWWYLKLKEIFVEAGPLLSADEIALWVHEVNRTALSIYTDRVNYSKLAKWSSNWTPLIFLRVIFGLEVFLSSIVAIRMQNGLPQWDITANGPMRTGPTTHPVFLNNRRFDLLLPEVKSKITDFNRQRQGLAKTIPVTPATRQRQPDMEASDACKRRRTTPEPHDRTSCDKVTTICSPSDHVSTNKRRRRHSTAESRETTNEVFRGIAIYKDLRDELDTTKANLRESTEKVDLLTRQLANVYRLVLKNANEASETFKQQEERLKEHEERLKQHEEMATQNRERIPHLELASLCRRRSGNDSRPQNAPRQVDLPYTTGVPKVARSIENEAGFSFVKLEKGKSLKSQLHRFKWEEESV